MSETEPIHVLLADDHPALRRGVALFLAQAGGIAVVAEASDGEQALQRIGDLLPDVAVLDIHMPGLTGLEVTRRVRAWGWRVGVLILSGYDDDATLAAVLDSGANGYVLKTAATEEILQAVRDVHQGKTVLDAALQARAGGMVSAPPAETGKAEAGEGLQALTGRELEILRLAAVGQTNKVIAVACHISDRTVQVHLAHIFSKLRVASRTEAVMQAIALGLVQPPVSRRGSPLTFDI
jgi:DNA-binding NarL/FixJ family response regulator